MPRIEASRVVPISPDVAFAVSQTHGEIRLAWDPFIHRQRLLGATQPGRGVRTETISRHRLRMVSEYVSFNPPTQVGMKMVEGPWFFSSFGGGWAFAEAPGGTRATWRYTFTVRPGWLAPVADRIGSWLLQRDIEARIDAFAEACRDGDIVAAATDVPVTGT